MATTGKKRRAARAGLGAVCETTDIPPLRGPTVVSVENAAGDSS
ncbi:hypothetical protein [Streptomyces sp. NPDC060184]